MSKPAIALVPPVEVKPDPAAVHATARRALAAAITAFREAESVLKVNTEALARASEIRRAAFNEIEGAEKAIEDAKDSLARRMTEALRAGSFDMPADDTEAALRTAQRRYEAIKAAQEALKAERISLESAVQIHGRTLTHAVSHVVVTSNEVAALLGPFRELKATYARAFGLLNYLAKQGALPSSFDGWDRQATEAAAADIEPWAQAIRDLSRSADARLPG